MNKEIPQEHDPTIEDTYTTSVEIKGNSVLLGNINYKYNLYPIRNY